MKLVLLLGLAVMTGVGQTLPVIVDPPIAGMKPWIYESCDAITEKNCRMHLGYGGGVGQTPQAPSKSVELNDPVVLMTEPTTTNHLSIYSVDNKVMMTCDNYPEVTNCKITEGYTVEEVLRVVIKSMADGQKRGWDAYETLRKQVDSYLAFMKKLDRPKPAAVVKPKPPK